ncbi:hypothetical protein HBI07_138890 [Parastagonospora nodorum]|nr:hypothetical protein HBI07_138890 [Parastagonospora nodorum]
MADSLRARTLINLSAVLYEQAAARTGLSAKVGNMDLNFVPSVAFIPNVHIANSLRTRTLINLSAVLYEQAAARTGLPAKISNISLRARTLINLSAVLYEQERTALLAKRIKTNEDCKKDNIEELICVGKVKNNRNNLNIIVTNPTSREFGRVDMKSLTRLCLLIDRAKLYYKRKWAHNISKFYKGKNIQLELGSIYVLRSVDEIQADVANVFDTVISKSDKVPTREPSSHIKIELRKFYRLVITGEDTHCKQIIKKAYIMSLERASLILFII